MNTSKSFESTTTIQAVPEALVEKEEQRQASCFSWLRGCMRKLFKRLKRRKALDKNTVTEELEKDIGIEEVVTYNAIEGTVMEAENDPFTIKTDRDEN